MKLRGLREIARGLTVTALAATGGAYFAPIFLGGNPFSESPLTTLAAAPFTLFGSFVILLPTYLWFSTGPRGSRKTAYFAVLAAGPFGGAAIMIVLGLVMAATPYSKPLGTEALTLYGLGAIFGFASAVCWVIAHYLTRSMSISQSSRL